MKRWRVRVEQTYVATVEVEANSSQEAMSLAVFGDPIPDDMFDPLAPVAVDARQVITNG